MICVHESVTRMKDMKQILLVSCTILVSACKHEANQGSNALQEEVSPPSSAIVQVSKETGSVVVLEPKPEQPKDPIPVLKPEQQTPAGREAARQQAMQNFLRARQQDSTQKH